VNGTIAAFLLAAAFGLWTSEARAVTLASVASDEGSTAESGELRHDVANLVSLGCMAGTTGCAEPGPLTSSVSLFPEESRNDMETLLWLGCATGASIGSGCMPYPASIQVLESASLWVPGLGQESRQNADCIFGEGCATYVAPALRLYPAQPQATDYRTMAEPLGVIVTFDGVVDPASSLFLLPLAHAIGEPLTYVRRMPGGGHLLAATRVLSWRDEQILLRRLRAYPQVRKVEEAMLLFGNMWLPKLVLEPLDRALPFQGR
jgi:hypothetical protein